MTAVYIVSDGREFLELSELIQIPGTVLIPVACEDWNRDLSPWLAPRAFSGGQDFSGGADTFLQKLLSVTVPEQEASLGISPDRRFLCGYSLAGLFSVYAATKTDIFGGVASVSGSLWFDGFTEYMKKQPLSGTVKRVYLSVGDREKCAKEARMKTVESCTRSVLETVRGQNADCVFELNQGGHFKDVTARLAKGILWLTSGAGTV